MNTKTLATINGIARSVTMWAAGILLSLGQIAPYVTPETLASIGISDGAGARKILTVCGLVMAACRLITSKGLADKGGLVQVTVPAAPAAQPTVQDAIVQPTVKPEIPSAKG